MRTRISVIIPIFNVQNFIEESLDSLLAQTILNLKLDNGYERNLQVIIVDDGSTDNSGDIAKRYASEYDFIQYHYYEESKGPGYARNYGCKFAEGDFMVFFDSDDLLLPYAYERMYKLALKNNSDMVIGAVLRFNSQNYWESNIHEIVFSGDYEVTHIKESPELFYDTTVWNKLIKRSFWNKYDFKFPEDILYEDIPITFYLHYHANNVSLIYETCYLWRYRDGSNISITQKTDSFQNLKDRLKIMGMVDTFFKKNVSEQNLIQAKSIKWLRIDLLIFIRILASLTTSEMSEFADLLRNYIYENINLDDLNYLHEIDKLKYEYLLNNNLKKLVDLVNFEKNDFQSINAYYKDSHLMIDVDEDIFGSPSFCIDDYVRRPGNHMKMVVNTAMKKNKIIIEGFTIIPGLKDESFGDRKYSFFLVNGESHKKIPLKFKNIKINDISKYYIPHGRNIPYESSGFRLSIPFSKLLNNNDFQGENRIQAIFEQKGIIYKYFLALNYKITNVKKKAKIYKKNYFFIDQDINNELLLNFFPIDYRYENVSIEDNRLCISSPDFNGELFLCSNKNLINDEYKIPFVYNNEDNYYSIDVNDIPKDIVQVRNEKDEPILLRRKKQLFLPSDKGQVIINALRDYHFDVCKNDSISLIENISANNEIIDLDVNLYTIRDIISLKSAKFYLQDENFNEILISEGNITGSSINFKLNFSNQDLLENIPQGINDFKVVYDLGEIRFSTPVYLKDQYSYSHSKNLFDYKIYRSAQGTLRIRLNKERNKRLDKWALLSKYEKLRHLPVHPKRIMFESLWGKQFNCNPRYFYEYINENHPDYECIWSFNDEQTYITGDAIRVRKYSLKYYYYLATSKYFVDNVNFEDMFVKKDDQVYVQTMHGTPLKTLGLDVPFDFDTNKKKRDFVNRCSRWNYLLVQSDYVVDLSKSCFEYDNSYLKFGYPRNDILFSKNNKKDIDNIKMKLNLPLDKKVILYAPTWRLKNKFELMIDLKSFKESLSDEYVLILRMHHYANNPLDYLENDDFVHDFSMYNSIEELYLISDILITDYSSAMFDYAILDRPIILFTYDLENYVKNIRGIYFDLEKNKPGPLLYTSHDVENAIINIDQIEEEYKPFRRKFQEKFNQYECENSSEQIFNEMVKGQKTNKIINSLQNVYSKIAFWIIKSL